MTDKEKILAEIERLRSDFPKVINQKEKECQWLYWRGLNKIRDFINSLPEEPISNPTPNERMSKERFAEACKAACNDRNYRSHYGLTETRDDYFVDGVQWADEHPIKELVSDGLEEAIDSYLATYWVGEKEKKDWPFLKKMAIHFAKWQKEQFEKNRLKHCNSITNEQAELEQGFIDQHLDKYRRMPTFLDAIEYGMILQKEQMMEKAVDGVVKIDAGGYPYVDRAIELYDYDKDIPLAKRGDKVKVLVIKED